MSASDPVIAKIAEWMLDTVRQGTYLDQDDAAERIAKNFGSQYVRDTDSGGYAIDRRVLAAFRKMHAGSAEWDSGERCWHAVAKPGSVQ